MVTRPVQSSRWRRVSRAHDERRVAQRDQRRCGRVELHSRGSESEAVEPGVEPSPRGRGGSAVNPERCDERSIHYNVCEIGRNNYEEHLI